MERITFFAPSRDFQIVLAGDTHLGGENIHWKGLDRLIGYILSKENRYWAHMGDWINAIPSDDPRFVLPTLDPKNPLSQATPIRQAMGAVEFFRPIAHRGICGLKGNHEMKLHRVGDLTRDIICEQLGIPFGSYTAIVVVMYGDEILFKMFLWHGPIRGAINSNAKDPEQRLANMKAALKMKLKYLIGDCAIMAMGHVHKLLVVEPTGELYLREDEGVIDSGYLNGIQNGNFIHPDQRYYVATGSFQKLYEFGKEGYAETFGYMPTDLGFPVINVQDGKITGIERRVV